MNEMPRIAVVDDHPLVREGIVRIVDEAGGYDVVALGATAQDAVKIASRGDVDVLFLDLNIPGGGLSALREIVATGALVRVIIITVSEEEEDVLNAFQSGAHAYMLKGIGSAELVGALETVIQKGSYVSPELGAKLLAGRRHADPAYSGPSDPLTQRERDIFDMVRRGLSNKEIGRELDLSEKTVKHHMTRIFRKLNVTNRLTLAMLRRP
jgi:two-component system, NarL family, nitrate/nitrite response regulator NarL